MKITFSGLSDERFNRPLQLIANLFFEEPAVNPFLKEKGDLHIEFKLEKIQDTITAEAILESEDLNYFSQYKKEVPLEQTDKEKFRSFKNGLSHVYLNVLQEFTGIIQPWGILTGIRPTKLFHKSIREGMPREDIRRKLKEDYLITDEKIELMERIVDRQLSVVPDLYSLQKEVSIYIGIPFCPTKCAYCTFPAYAILGKQGRVDSFLTGLHYEIQETGRWLKENGVRITTVYYGGGTPTSITAEQMDMLYEEMYRSFPDVAEVREVTVEAGRPDTISPEKLDVLNKWNIDRISINPQSYTNETLKAIGRHHSVEETIEKFHLAREMGMKNINMDLIIGLPGEGVEEFTHSLNETKKLMPESLTVHTLSFKRASEMTRNKEKYKVAGREEIERMMSLADEWTQKHDYAPYYLYRQKNILGNLENVGYALPGQDSIYNIMIMEEMQTIIGIGCGAASKFIDPETGKITHFANPKEPKAYNEGFKNYTEKKLQILDELLN
ncbi:coproporphyrinogen III oxidase [Rossellomorea vietnamensis]|uniref:Coproporphyrinogen III oxidase n=1 Tax=Rossellomorea vietnamensis TaxID=218284 RepID=A0A5D4MCZ0_9BACI|nr:coproporphyrinogen III oxidase [Rossellomorea vietnamensis]TYR99542.1 coproporphyrinogen III oxidase [Rossellomorea vietnamensis]